MTATPPRSSGSSRACPSAAAPSAGCGGRGACRPSAGAGLRQHRARRPRHPALGAPRPRRRQSVRLARHGDPWPSSSAPSTMRRAPSWPCTSGPRRISTAISPCSGRLAACDGLPVTLYGDRLGIFVRNDAHWSARGGAPGRPAPHPVRPGPAGPRDRLHRRPLAPSQGPHRTPLGNPARSPRRRAAPARHPRPSRRPKPSCPPTSSTTTAASRSPRPTRPPPGAARPVTSPIA